MEFNLNAIVEIVCSRNDIMRNQDKNNSCVSGYKDLYAFGNNCEVGMVATIKVLLRFFLTGIQSKLFTNSKEIMENDQECSVKTKLKSK